MKINIVKAVLLILLTIGAIIGIGCYYKTKVTPPQKLEFSNKHLAEVKEIIMEFDSLSTDGLRDSWLFTVHNKIELYNKEGFVKNQERDELMEVMVGKYVPVFIESSMAKFQEHTWYYSDRDRMKDRITELKSYKINNGTEPLIQGEYIQSFDKILNIIRQFNLAA